MAIVIKELFPSDPISEALEKINFNFDQLILAGGGPPGPQGPLGPPGIPGPQGDRGDHWQVGGASGPGFTGPTSDHGPLFGSLKDTDHWIDDLGDVWEWIGASAIWDNTGVNLKGPTGAIGATGGSFEWGIYYGRTGAALSGNGWYIDPTTGPTTVDNSNNNFIVSVNGYKNNLFLGDQNWAYNSLFNQAFYSASALGTYPKLAPKLTVVQNLMDGFGFGGIQLYALGLTGSTGALANYVTFQGGSTATPVDGRDGFSAGFAIGVTASSTIYHTFRARTNTVDFEIQAGDNAFNTQLTGGKQPKIIARSNFFNYQDFDASDPIQIFSSSTGTRLRDRLIVGWNSVLGFSSIDSGIILDANGSSRLRGDVYVGDKSGATSYIGLGQARTAVGNSIIDFFADTSSTESFRIQRLSGTNGVTQLVHNGTGKIEYKANTNGSFHEWLVNPGSGSFGLMKLDTNGRLTIGHTQSTLHRLDVDRTFGIDGNVASNFSDLTHNISNLPVATSTLGGPGSYIKLRGGSSERASISLYTSPDLNSLAAGAFMTIEERMRIHANGRVTLGQPNVAPVFDLSFPEWASRSIGIERVTSTNVGRNLLIEAGGAFGSDQSGGILILRSGRSTGSAVGEIQLFSSPNAQIPNPTGYNNFVSIPNVRIIGSTNTTTTSGFVTINQSTSYSPNTQLDVNGSITIYQNEGTNDQRRLQGLRFNLSGQSSPSTLFSGIFPYEANAASDQLGISLVSSGGSGLLESARIYENGKRVLLGIPSSDSSTSRSFDTSSTNTAQIDTKDDMFSANNSVTGITPIVGANLISSGSFNQINFTWTDIENNQTYVINIYQQWQRVGKIVTVYFQIDPISTRWRANYLAIPVPILTGSQYQGFWNGRGSDTAISTLENRLGRISGSSNEIVIREWDNFLSNYEFYTQINGTYSYILP